MSDAALREPCVLRCSLQLQPCSGVAQMLLTRAPLRSLCVFGVAAAAAVHAT